jgi:hypothetical protein
VPDSRRPGSTVCEIGDEIDLGAVFGILVLPSELVVDEPEATGDGRGAAGDLDEREDVDLDLLDEDRSIIGPVGLDLLMVAEEEAPEKDV